MFRLKKSSSSYLRTINLIKIRLCTFGIPDGSQCVLGFAYNVIPTYYCIYVYTGGDVCAVCWGRCSLIGVLVMSVVVFFPSSCFSVSREWGGGGAFPLVVCLCFCFASCFSSVSTKLGNFMFVITILRVAVCVIV